MAKKHFRFESSFDVSIFTIACNITPTEKTNPMQAVSDTTLENVVI